MRLPQRGSFHLFGIEQRCLAAARQALEDLLQAHRTWDCELHERSAAEKGPDPNMSDGRGDREACQGAAECEGHATDSRHGAWDGELSQRAAVVEGIIPDTGHGIRYFKAGQ